MTAPTTTGSPVSHLASRRWVGIDTYHNPGDLGPGYLRRADNVYIKGGELVTRPGVQGQFTTPLGAPLYAPLPFLKADATTALLFTSGGKLYQAAKEATTYAEILNGTGSFSLVSKNTFMARLGKYAYGVDGSGPLFRTDLATGGVVTSLNNPTSAPAVALTDRLIAAASSPAAWSYEGLAAPGTTHGLQGGDALSAGSYSVPPGFTADNLDGSVDLSLLGPSGGHTWTQFDDYGDQMTSSLYQNLQTVAALPAQLGGRWASQFLVSMNLLTLSGGYGVEVTLLAFADAGGATPLAQQMKVLRAGAAVEQEVTANAVFDFSALSTPILSYQVRIRSSVYNSAGNNVGVGVRNVFSNPYLPFWTAGASGGQVGFRSDAVGATGQHPAPAGTLAWGGSHLTLDLGAPTDLSTTNTLLVSVGQVAPLTGLGLEVGLRTGGGTTSLTNPVTFSASGTEFHVDISTITAAGRQAVRYLDFIFTGNAEVSSGGDGVLLTLGPVYTSGNLSVGYSDYLWLFTEENENGDPSLVAAVESGESPASARVTPTAEQAEALVTLPAPVNGSAGRFRLWRAGGTFSDGLFRLVVSYRYDGSAGDETANPYVSYDSATKTVTDNTPDEWLVGAETLITGRVPPPVGAQAIAQWQGRLWLAQGSTLYASWLVSGGLQNALYFSAVNLSPADDPNAPIKGAQFSLGGPDNDPIQALIPYGTSLVVLKQYSVWLVFGYDPTNFAAQSYLIGAGVGCVAPRACGVVGNHVWFRSADGVYEFDADVVNPKSIELESVLTPHGDTGESVNVPASVARSAMVYHDRRLLLLSPLPGQAASGTGDAANSAGYLWDSRTSGWTRWLGMTFTGGASLSGGTDSNDLFLAGQDGQMYYLNGSVDKSTPTAAGVPIAFTVASRGFGQEGDSDAFYRRDQPTRFYLDAECSVPLTVGISLQGDGAAYATAYLVGPGTNVRLKLPGGLRGELLSVTLTGQAAAQLTIRAFALDIVKGQARD